MTAKSKTKRPAERPAAKAGAAAARRPASAAGARRTAAPARPAPKAAKAPAKAAPKPAPDNKNAVVKKPAAPPVKVPPRAGKVPVVSKPAARPDVARNNPNKAQPITKPPSKVRTKEHVEALAEFGAKDYIVYPTHGVGYIQAVERQEIAGMQVELFVITFEKDKMTLRVPVGKAKTVGMRKLSTPKIGRAHV